MKYKNNFFYGWVIIFACVSLNCIGMGIISMMGIFFPSISDTLNISQTQVSMLVTFLTIGTLLGSTIAGKILPKLGSRKVVLIFGIITSLLIGSLGLVDSLIAMYFLSIMAGISMFITSFVTIPTLVTTWFKEKRGFAMGIAMSGIGLSTAFISPYLSPIIIEKGFKTGFLYLSIIMLVTSIISSLIIKNTPSQMGLKPYGQNQGDKVTNKNSVNNECTKNVELKIAIKSPSFLLLVIFGMATLFTSIGIVIQIPSYLNYLELSQSTIGIILSGFGIFMTIGKIIIGIIYDKLGLYKANFLLFTFMIISLISLYIMPSKIGIVTFILLGGLGFCFNTIANALAISELFGPKNYSKIYSIYMLFFSLGAIISTILSGVFIDKLGFTALFFGGVVLGILGLISICLALTLGDKTKNQIIATSVK